jgi:hypothetical protein
VRRDAVIRDEVKFLAYVRPRAVDLARRSAAGWRLEWDQPPSVVPTCEAQHDEPPDALRAYVQLFRHAPARWFTAIAPRLKELNTGEKLFQLITATKQSAAQFSFARQLPFLPAALPAGSFAAIQSGFSIIEAARVPAARLAIAAPDLISWTEQRRVAEEHAALGDVMDGRHGSPPLARAAADELEHIEDVATCLHAEFAAVAPAIRLAWVERYSQFDRSSPLHDLTVLPDYQKLPRASRRRFQTAVDWLFGRVAQHEGSAVNLVNDLVRICLLLASHAPVKQLIAGHVPRPVPVRPGVRIPIKPIDPKLVRVGMDFHVWQDNRVVVRGRVDDLKDGAVSAIVDHVAAVSQTTTIDQTMRVQFTAPALTSRLATVRR